MGKLEGKVAIVTGASKGIGAGIALRLAADGARAARDTRGRHRAGPGGNRGTSEMGAVGAAPFVARTPLGRNGQPADIAAVAFVVSGDGGWVTGETLQVGGGLRL